MKRTNDRGAHLDNMAQDASAPLGGTCPAWTKSGTPGLVPRSKLPYGFPIRPAGTCCHHSHSGLQEPMGRYGRIVIDPAGAT